jgi:hypothetical protein
MEEDKNLEQNLDNSNEKLHISGVSCRFISRKTIREIIELSAHEQSEGGYVWGDDTILGTMDELIDNVIEIIKRNDN